MRWSVAFSLLTLATAVPACTEHAGHQGVRDDGAVSAAMKLKTRETIYRHTLSERYAGYEANGEHGYARVRMVVRFTNDSDHNVIVRECSGRAENARGQQLFNVEPFPGDSWALVLAPGTGFGGPMGYSPRDQAGRARCSSHPRRRSRRGKLPGVPMGGSGPSTPGGLSAGLRDPDALVGAAGKSPDWFRSHGPETMVTSVSGTQIPKACDRHRNVAGRLPSGG